jgi:hypothetical protein
LTNSTTIDQLAPSSINSTTIDQLAPGSINSTTIDQLAPGSINSATIDQLGDHRPTWRPSTNSVLRRASDDVSTAETTPAV